MGFQEEPSGGGSATPRTFTSASTPTVAEDSSSGYRVGDKWVVTGDDGVSSGYVYECTDNSVGAAAWFPPQRYPVPPAELPSAINATKIASGAISNTEFQYLNNVSSNIQTQLDAKAPLAIGPTIAALTSKSTPVTADDFLISDSAASDVAKRVTYGDLLTTLRTALGIDKPTTNYTLLTDSNAFALTSSLTWYALTFDTEQYDAQGQHSGTSEDIVIATTGVYDVYGQMLVFRDTADGTLFAQIGINNSPVKALSVAKFPNSAFQWTSAAVVGRWSLTAGDTVSLMALCSGTGATVYERTLEVKQVIA